MKSTEANKISDDELELINGGVGVEKEYYCVEGYSEHYGGKVKLYALTFHDAVKLCVKLGLGTDCIKEVSGTY